MSENEWNIRRRETNSECDHCATFNELPCDGKNYLRVWRVLFHHSTVEIVISEQWSWKVAWFLKEDYCPARNHTTLHDLVLLVTFPTVHS